ncbi:hypothetical protein ACFOLF_12660 [Paenibacillus sepulcri]|uniref:Ferric siderophore reductase C-terminal domain-containing protein n=1 Tax=Paenibacillus sepulcri TaxID=359917 RepID=A0ABS7BY50_9BACL|nr:hypothetical protein [Paenibacillus sepulcri]
METRPEVLARFNHDYKLQTELLGAEVFNLRRNPFYHIPRYIESPYKPGEQIMMRSSCCMYYCQEDGQMCYTCPRLTSGERNEMKEKIMAAAK